MTALDRLYPSSVAPASILRDVLPTWFQPFAHRAALGDEHLVALTIWFTAGTPAVLGAWVVLGRSSAIGLLVMMIVVPTVVMIRWRDRRRQRVIAALPEVVDAFGRSIRSGGSFAQSLAETIEATGREVGEELAAVLAGIRRGQPSADALAEWVVRVPDHRVRVVAAALALASEHEAAAAQALSGVQQSLRDEVILDDELRTLTAQASSSVRALVLLPIGFLVLDLVSTQRTLSFLVTTRLGRACLIVGMGLNAIGSVWMRALIGRAAAR